jgi:hypothetical protein
MSYFVAAAIATGMILKTVSTINDVGSEAGLKAANGSTFLVLFWAMVVLMLISTISSTLLLFSDRVKGHGRNRMMSYN